ncbi:MAG: peptide deformylase [Candidatus Sungbacteria bacterium]|uniref:Peptide deformylase n=1 Tax=Candidatus Sungiibacteriota bacterium TaxID=2750080 RepID=A0A933DTA9_9BACT|nr:peptide deformylase [Candidatus Sungbacteria bacterium]
MPRHPVVLEPNKVLRAPAQEIAREEISSAKIQRLISDMKETLTAAPDGVGLAASQVGVSLQLFLVSEEAQVIDIEKPDAEPQMGAEGAHKKRVWKYFTFINPVLIKQSRKRLEMAEGCLSLPGKFGAVLRSEKVSIAWLDENGEKHSRGFTKFFARVIQHEMDHLSGILISDRAKKLISMPHDKATQSYEL